MAGENLTLVTRTQGNNRALKDGSVKLATAPVEFVEVPVLVHAFRRMVRELEFDISEMAATTYLCAREHGVRFTALPIFLVRGFHDGAILHSAAHPITTPQNLEGRRVGINRGYTVTTGVWARGILEQQYGVDLSRVTWVLSGDEHVADYRPPPNVEPMPAGADLTDLVASGELAAAIGLDADRADRADLSPLIEHSDEVGYAALCRTGHYPINHLIVVRDDVLAAHPGLAEDVFAAFTEAKSAYVDALRTDAIEAPTKVDRMYRRVMDITGDDPLPYGIEPNRAVLEELIGHAVRQQILRSAPEVDSLFAENTRHLVG